MSQAVKLFDKPDLFPDVSSKDADDLWDVRDELPFPLPPLSQEMEQ